MELEEGDVEAHTVGYRLRFVTSVLPHRAAQLQSALRQHSRCRATPRHTQPVGLGSGAGDAACEARSASEGVYPTPHARQNHMLSSPMATGA